MSTEFDNVPADEEAAQRVVRVPQHPLVRRLAFHLLDERLAVRRQVIGIVRRTPEHHGGERRQINAGERQR